MFCVGGPRMTAPTSTDHIAVAAHQKSRVMNAAIVLYKATRSNGRDFRTGTIDYAAALVSGEVVRHPVARKVRDLASTYLSVSVSPTDCTGFSWPCRLFRVEPVGRVMASLSASPSKRAVSALRVVEELPAWQVFGPQGRQVAAVIERAMALTQDEARRLAAARDAAWAAAGAAAGAAVWAAAGAAARAAAGAHVVRDLIPATQFVLLAGPWLGVICEAA